MDKEYIELVMSHLHKMESAFRSDISEIKNDLKRLSEHQSSLSEAIARLSLIEDKYLYQLNNCNEVRVQLEKIKSDLNLVDKRIIPIETLYESVVTIKRKIFAGLAMAIITGLATFVLTVTKMLN